MKMLLPAFLLLFSLSAPLFADEPSEIADQKRTALFTEKELRDGRFEIPNFLVDPCRVTIEYVAEKPMTLVLKPGNNAFMGFWRHALPAASEPRRETCDFQITAILPDMEFRVEGGGKHEIRSLTAEEIPLSEYRPATVVPNPRRKGAIAPCAD